MKPTLETSTDWIVTQASHLTTTANHGFDDDGCIVPITWPTDGDDHTDAAPAIHGATEAALDFATMATTLPEVAERAVLLSVILKTPASPKTMRDLGTRLGCSHTAARTRLSKFREQLRQELHKFTP
jgi:DNA-directed RNA polymerase specialized sigma24 family protein